MRGPDLGAYRHGVSAGPPVGEHFFEQVLDALTGSVAGAFGPLRSSVHRRGVKVWFVEPEREHYEAQLVRVDGEIVLEIGFHAEHAKAPLNEAAIERLVAVEPTWRPLLGDEAVLGAFLGRSTWRRVSECWPVPGLDVGAEIDDELDATIEVAARLADYITAIEPCRRRSST